MPGKTVTGEMASSLLGASATLEQDTFHHLGKKAKAKCLEVCEGHFRDPRLRYVWLLRNNSQLGQYSQFIALARQHAWRTPKPRHPPQKIVIEGGRKSVS